MEINDTSIPAIAHMFRFQWEEAQDCYVVLYPEGMVKLSGSAGEIMKRVDGKTPVADMVTDISNAFDGADVKDDVIKFLETAYGNGWISFSN